MAEPIDRFLRELRDAFRGNPLLARRVLEEVQDHLAEIVAREMANGTPRHEAEEIAVERFGSARTFAGQFDRLALPIKLLFWGASLVTIGVAAWLMTVIAWILPSRDPGHIPLWTGVTIGYLVFSGLSIAYLRLGPRWAALRITVLGLSISALAAAVYGVYEMLRAAQSGGDFEGYLLLMSVLLAGHGLVAIAYTWMTTVIARRVAVG